MRHKPFWGIFVHTYKMKGAKYKLGGAGFKCLMNCILLHFQAIYRSRSHEGTIPTILICHSHYHFQKWYRIIKLLFPPNPFPTFSPLLLTFSSIVVSSFFSSHVFVFLFFVANFGKATLCHCVATAIVVTLWRPRTVRPYAWWC